MIDLPRLTEPIGNWVDDGLCGKRVAEGTAHPSWWFPTGKIEMRLVNQAKAICEACPVKQQCLDWAIRHEQYGIWGGVGPRQRELLSNGRRSICKFCGEAFVPRSMNALYCSRGCNAAIRLQRKRENWVPKRSPIIEGRCPICDDTFVNVNGQKVYCSNKCRKKMQRVLKREKKEWE